ncbi:MAG TPA: hypothetical protein VE153_20385 [Myxococcus sp.]|jgi:hypothetical protein|nr:hypothetical protein [Myxococcus sp.]
MSNAPAAAAAPRVVTATLASALEGYLVRAQELGAVEGTGGALALNPALKPVLQALHHVLAGGEVDVRIVRTGNLDLVSELDHRADEATQEANTLTGTGYALTATV